MKPPFSTRGFTLVEVMIATAITSMVGLMLYTIFYTGTILGAKNTAINTAHQQARIAMINILQNIHSAVSPPVLTDAGGTPYSSPPPSAAGVSFQQWSSGPHKIISDALATTNQINITVTGATLPAVGQHIIIPSHQIEADISACSGNAASYTMTLTNIWGPSITPPVVYPVSSLPIDIKGTGSTAGDVICFITDRCSYTVSNGTLSWNKLGTSRVASNDITNSTPFSIPTTPAGAYYSRFVAAIDLSTSDAHYSNRGFKSANILLNGQVPQKAQLTTYQ